MKFSKGDGILSTLLIYSAIAAVVLLSMTLAFAAFFYAGEASISNVVSWRKIIILFGLGMESCFLTQNFSVRRLLANFCAF